MKGIVYQGPETVACQDNIPQPQPRDGWVLIRGSHAGICGSDLIIYSGTHPRAKAPLVMGHEFSGTLVSGHPTLPAGTPVSVNPLLSCGHCEPCTTGQTHVCDTLGLLGIDADGGMGEYILAPVQNVIPLPEGVSMKMGAFIEPVAVAVHAIRKGGYRPGDSVVVFGAGAIGLCTAVTLQKFGAVDLTLVEANPLRVKSAQAMGFKVLNPGEVDIPAEIRKNNGGVGADCVFDCAGHPSVTKLLTETVKTVGHIVIVGAYKHPPEVDMQKAMFKELSMQFVRVYTHKDYKIAAELVATEKAYEKIVTHVLKPEQAQEGFDLMLKPSDALKVLFCFD